MTSQQLQNYYDIYRDKEVTYTKDVLRTLSIDPRQIYVKCNGAQWPCIINSTSFQCAKIIVGTKGGAYASISKKEPPPVSLRFYFSEQQPISFFVTGRVTDIQPYLNSTELTIITITFTQRPPDDLIGKIGSLLEANTNAIKRKEERITITDESKRRLQLTKDQTVIFIQNVPRRCIVRDISFSGAKVILVGIEKFVQDKDAILSLLFDEPTETINIYAHVVKTIPVENKPEIIYACLQFDESKVPTSYKIRINTYLTTLRKTILSAVQDQQKDKNKKTDSTEKPENNAENQTETTSDSTTQEDNSNVAQKKQQPDSNSKENISSDVASGDATSTENTSQEVASQEIDSTQTQTNKESTEQESNQT